MLVFEPMEVPEPKKGLRTGKVPHMTPGRAALVGLMRRYLDGLMDPFVTLLEVHKLLYFMQEAGEQLRLRYVQAPFGPYAENLRHVLREIEGYYVSGYADGGDVPDKELAIVPGAERDAEEFLVNHPDTRARFERVSKLVQGFESPFGLELLSTVYWVAMRSNVRNVEEVIGCIYGWSDRKMQFTPRQIRLTLNMLVERKWLPASFHAA